MENDKCRCDGYVYCDICDVFLNLKNVKKHKNLKNHEDFSLCCMCFDSGRFYIGEGDYMNCFFCNICYKNKYNKVVLELNKIRI